MATSLQNTRMLLSRAFLRNVERKEILARKLCVTPTFNSKKDEDDTSKKNAKSPAKPKISNEERELKQKEAKAKLNSLLESMNKESKQVYSVESKLSLATPQIKPKVARTKPTTSKIEPEMIQAVEKVSESFKEGKDELKKKLIAKLEAVADESETNRLEPFKPNKKKTEDLNNLLNTLKVDIKKPRKTAEPKLASTKIETLYSAKPSGIFSNAKFKEESETVSKLTTWEKLNRRELELAVTHPPANGFQQMILWTKQGKMWQFPIDNEQGLEEEAQVGFHEHVFLEPYLEPWCPRRGPLRHFMELVIIGLSKNPYFTVAQKKDHINWFRDFFDAKRSILVETGAIPDEPSRPAPSLSA